MSELRSRALYLGTPGNMIELPSPSKSGLSAPRSRGRVVHGLYGGGQAVTTNPYTVRSWGYQWPALSESDWQVLAAFDSWLNGAPPWCLVPPEGVNVLTSALSLCRVATATAPSWVVNGTGTLVSDASAPALTVPAPSGVLKWTPATAAESLVGGVMSGATSQPDLNYGAVNIPAETVQFSFYAKAVSGSATSVKARVRGMSADGSGASNNDGTSVTLSSSAWSQVSVQVAVNRFAASVPYLVPVIQSNSATALAMYLSCAQLSYSSGLMTWAVGGGIPRVNLSTDLSNDLAGLVTRHGTQATFVEAYAGAAV